MGIILNYSYYFK